MKGSALYPLFIDQGDKEPMVCLSIEVAEVSNGSRWFFRLSGRFDADFDLRAAVLDGIL